jgi:nicotinate-nucleotide pyrophosphorylase (carboxylating)
MSEMAKHPVPENVEVIARAALMEDVGTGDLTALVIPPSIRCDARVSVREHAVLCGIPWFEAVYRLIDREISIDWHAADGDEVDAGFTICRLRGCARNLLTGERTALNFLQTLSGTATVTREYVRVLEGTRARLLDTRKTIPGLRLAQKYAVVCGGGHNHRFGLYDAILIKENHIAAAGSIGGAVRAARKARTDVPVEVEVESLDQVEEALEAGAKMLLLDNLSIEQIREAVSRVAGRALLEASGGLDQSRLRQVAETGVDCISVGALTKHLRSIDMTMRVEMQ